MQQYYLRSVAKWMALRNAIKLSGRFNNMSKLWFAILIYSLRHVIKTLSLLAIVTITVFVGVINVLNKPINI